MTAAEQLDPRPDTSRWQALANRIEELEADRHADREIIADLQDKVIEREMAFRNLEGAIASSRRIGAAIGIVMAAAKITEDDAFTALSTISQRQNRKLRLVADDIVLTGTF